MDIYISEVEKANSIVDAINQLDNMKSDVEENCNQLLNSIKRQIEILTLAGGEENFGKIVNIYENILNIDKTNLEILSDYIDFLNTYNDYDKALNVFKDTCPYLDNNLKMKERILTNIGNSFNQLMELDNAIDCYQQALSIIDSLESLDEDYKLHRQEVVLSNLGVAYTRKRDYKNASFCFEECNNLYNNHNDNKLSKFDFIGNYASLYRIMKEYEKSDSILSVGLSCLSTIGLLDNSQKKKIAEYRAILNQGRGNVATNMGNGDKARYFYQETISILKSLYDENPRKYVVNLAIANYNFGRSYIVEDESAKEAIPFLESSLNLYESVLHNSFIQRVADNYAETITVLGRIYTNRKDTTECFKLCERIDQSINSCKDFPYKGANLLAAAGTILADLKMHKRALEYYFKAVKAIEILYEAYPTVYKIDMVQLYNNIAGSLCHNGNFVEGKDYFARSLSLSEELYLEKNIDKTFYRQVINRGFLFLVTSSEPLAALDYLRKLQELEPNNVELFEYECIILGGNGHMADAKNAFIKLLKRFPDYPKDSELYKNLGSK